MKNQFRIKISLERNYTSNFSEDARDNSWHEEQSTRYLIEDQLLPAWRLYSKITTEVSGIMIAEWKSKTPDWEKQVFEAILKEKRR